MNILTKKNGSNYYIYFHGELDEYSASKTRKQVDELLDENVSCDRVVFNLNELSFMDSTGIGFLLGRYKKMKNYNTPIYIECNNPSIDKIVNLSGLYNIMPKI